MRLAVVGVGSCGSRVANRILRVEQSTGRHLCDGNAVLIDSSETAFDTKCLIPDDQRLLIGDVHREVDGQGTDGDVELGAEIAQEDRHEIIREFDAIDFTRVDGVLVAAGLGGGTGGGAGAVVIEALTSIMDDPVYGLGVLPQESEGAPAALNAARGLQSFVSAADNVIVFDNEAWQPDDADSYTQANLALARRIVTLFAAGEFDAKATPENRMDPSDMMRTLETGGLSSIGYAATDVSKGWRGWLAKLKGLFSRDGQEDPATAAAKINNLVRRAAKSRLTLPCNIESTERALIMFSGPPRELSRKGFESGRYWLEEEADTVDVMAGDEPHNKSSELTATIVFSNVTDVPRIEAMQARAKGAEPGADEESVEVDEEGGTFVFEDTKTF